MSTKLFTHRDGAGFLERFDAPVVIAGLYPGPRAAFSQCDAARTPHVAGGIS